jgi:hypothetical protein
VTAVIRAFLAVLVLCAVAGPAPAGDGSITYEPRPGPGGRQHIVFLTGDEEYRSEEGLPMLAKILSQRHGFRCTVLFALDADGTINPDRNDSLSDPDALDSADAVVMMLRFRAYPDAVMKRFAAAVDRGVPILGLRTSTHAFRFPGNSSSHFKDYNDFGRRVLGENWVSHWGANRQGATRGVVEPSAIRDPLLNGVGGVFGDSGVYETHPTPDSKILLRGQVLKGMKPTDPPADYRKKRASDRQEQGVNDPMMPIAWSRVSKNAAGTENRVFCTTLGAATDLTSEGLRRLVVNAVYWGLRLEVPAKADVDYVDPYNPSAYAFKGYRHGLRPSDHALGKTLPPGTGSPR